MSEFVDCRTCKTYCVRADGNYGYTFCDKYTPTPMTNGDRIRSMTDEKLSVFLCEEFDCGSESCPGIELCKPNEGRANGLLKWLQQPAETPKEE